MPSGQYNVFELSTGSVVGISTTATVATSTSSVITTTTTSTISTTTTSVIGLTTASVVGLTTTSNVGLTTTSNVGLTTTALVGLSSTSPNVGFPPLATSTATQFAIAVTSSTTLQTALNANAARKGALLYNQGPGIVYVNFSNTQPSTALYSMGLMPASTAAGGAPNVYNLAQNSAIATSAISVIGSTAAVLMVTEFI